jgi:hypothetical protein
MSPHFIPPQHALTVTIAGVDSTGKPQLSFRLTDSYNRHFETGEGTELKISSGLLLLNPVCIKVGPSRPEVSPTVEIREAAGELPVALAVKMTVILKHCANLKRQWD